jgi:hypothetical protein
MTPVGVLAWGDSTDMKKADGTNIAAMGIDPPHKPFHGIGEVGLVHVAQSHERQDEPDAGMRVSRAPKILAQRVLPIGRIAN